MNNNVNELYEKFILLSSQIKSLNSELDGIKKQIIEEHHGNPELIGDKYKSLIVECTRNTLLEKEVQAKYNIKFVAEDYKHTNYNRLQVIVK